MFKFLKKSPTFTFVFLLVILGGLVSTLPAKAKPAYAFPEFTQTKKRSSR